MLEPSINWWRVGDPHVHEPALGWMILTFAVFAGLLVYFFKRPLRSYFEMRHDHMKQAILEAKEAKELAASRLEQAKQKWLALENEILAMRRSIVEQGEQEQALLERTAQDIAERIKRDAQATIQAEKDRSDLELQSLVGRLAIELAQKDIKELLSQKAHQRFIHTKTIELERQIALERDT